MMRKKDITFCIGPAGTGKTYLAVGMAVAALRQGQVKKHRAGPARGRGRRAARLPARRHRAKINPYLRPLLDALDDMMDHEQVSRYMEQRHHRDRARWRSCAAGR